MPHPQFLFDVSGELLVTNGTFSEECSAFFFGLVKCEIWIYSPSPVRVVNEGL